MSLNVNITGNDLIDILKLFKINLLDLFSNKDILDKLSIDENNNLLYDGKKISTSSSEDEKITFNEYNNTLTYSINDYVVYNHCLYKCIEDITTPENFNESKWEIILKGEKGDPGEKGLDAANISKLYCKDNNLYIDFDNDTTKQIENFSLNKAVNEQVEYGQFGFNSSIEQISTLDTLIPFKTKVGNIDLNSDGTITLKANKTYKLSCYFRISDTDALKSLTVKQNGTFLFNVVAKASEITETCTSVYIFAPTEDTKIGLYTTTYATQLPTLTSVAFYDNTKLIVEEIAQPVINNINSTYKETILYKNSIPIVGTLDNLDATKYATTEAPMELTFDKDLSQYDRLEIVLGTVTYSGNNYWIPINDKVQGKANENIYYRNCLMVTNNSYCSVQLDYIYTDKKIILRNYGMSTSDMKGATVLKVIGIKY